MFTCNIDGLDHQTSVPHDKIVAVHGTLSRARCEFCRHEMPSDTFRELVRANIKDISASDPSAPAESSAIKCPQCDRAGMKPSTVLYDADLDAGVLQHLDEHLPADILFVVGTSLYVQPSASIPSRSKAAMRVFVNREPPPPFVRFRHGRDHLLQGECDEMFVALTARLGWLPDLARFRDEWLPASQTLFDEALRKSAT